MAYKGKFSPKNFDKYVGDPTKITYRSLWERRFMVFCDENKSILKWGSEEVVVPYISPIDNRYHRYFVDFIIEYKTKDGHKKIDLIEIKPKAQSVPPKKKDRVTQRYLREVKRWGVNQAKWKAATETAENRGWGFKVLTEKELFKNGR